MNWYKRRVIVTSRAGLIGSNLVDRLLGSGTSVTLLLDWAGVIQENSHNIQVE